jgi:hypothetical protein
MCMWQRSSRCQLERRSTSFLSLWQMSLVSSTALLECLPGEVCAAAGQQGAEVLLRLQGSNTHGAAAAASSRAVQHMVQLI